MDTQTLTQVEQFDRLTNIVRSAHTTMFVTKRPDGTMHGRPMAAAEVPAGLHLLYFATSSQSAKVDELQQSDQVLLGYTSSDTKWATINGRARVVNDRAKIHELWSPLWKNWFDGPDDPNLTLIAVTPESAEYWDGGSKIGVFTKLAIAAVTGRKMSEGDHEQVRLAK